MENGQGDMGVEGGGWDGWGDGTDMEPLPCVKQAARGKLLPSTGSSALCSVMTQRAGMREAQEGGDICIFAADSHCHIAETNTTLQSNYTLFFN